MILSPHALAGATIASTFHFSPVIAFFAGFASHFILDMLPHWDYKLRSAELDELNPLNNDIIVGRKFIFDLLVMGIDVSLGFFFAGLFFVGRGPVSTLAIVSGAVGGVLPDALQFVYMKFRIEPFTKIQRLHLFMHSGKKIESPVWGVFWYAILFLIFFLVGNWRIFTW